MKVLVTGVKGQLGYDVVNELNKREMEAVGVDIDEMDITDYQKVVRVMGEVQPDGVIHCAAYTAVDAAEDHQELCMKINREGSRNIANTCKELDIPMIYISTDYVFNGQGNRPWEPEDECEPLNVYGQSKYEGELSVRNTLDKYFIVRISWVFGINGKNFVKAIMNRAKEQGEVSVVNDQYGSPTYTSDLAVLLADMILTDRYGIYHASNEGICTWYEFACEIIRQAAILSPDEFSSVIIKPVSSNAYPVKAKRPFNSRMNKDKLEQEGFQQLPSWQDALKRYFTEWRKRNES